MKQTSEQWAKSPKYEAYIIMDPDGWDRQNYHHSFHEELISEDEFNKRLSMSTVLKRNLVN